LAIYEIIVGDAVRDYPEKTNSYSKPYAVMAGPLDNFGVNSLRKNNRELSVTLGGFHVSCYHGYKLFLLSLL